MSCWIHEKAEAQDEAGKRVDAAWADENGKDECIAQLEGNEQFCWAGGEIGMLGG